MLPPPTTRSCVPSATLTPSPERWTTTSFPIRPVQPGRRCTASSRRPGPIFTWTRSRSTFRLQVQVWSVLDRVVAEPERRGGEQDDHFGGDRRSQAQAESSRSSAPAADHQKSAA